LDLTFVIQKVKNKNDFDDKHARIRKSGNRVKGKHKQRTEFVKQTIKTIKLETKHYENKKLRIKKQSA